MHKKQQVAAQHGLDREHRRPANDMAASAIRERVDELPPVERYVLSALYGLGGDPVDAEEIARRTGLPLDDLWRYVRRGAEEVGFRLVTELAA